MTWTRIESSMPRHPKVAGLSVHAKWAFIEALCWSVEQHTDGCIPASVPFRTFSAYKPADVMAELVTAGLLEQNGDGLLVHDFDDYQMSGAQDKARREAAALRKRRERQSKEKEVT
jgi:hypothetical protein